jgi:hypothetical protein
VPDTRKTRDHQRLPVLLATTLAVAFLVVELPPYLTLDPARSRLPEPAGMPWHYPLLVGHILFGSVALVTGCLQVWRRPRVRWPRLHRRVGRAYLFAGVFPGGLLVLGVAPVSSTGFVSSVGNTMLALLWLATGYAGWRAARQGRFREHRLWMVRSVALTTSIVLNRAWLIGMLLVADAVGAGGPAVQNQIASASVWLSWVVNLLVAEWWLTRRPARRGPASPGPRAARARAGGTPAAAGTSG